jgi:hypothetical protein
MDRWTESTMADLWDSLNMVHSINDLWVGFYFVKGFDYFYSLVLIDERTTRILLN